MSTKHYPSYHIFKNLSSLIAVLIFIFLYSCIFIFLFNIGLGAEKEATIGSPDVIEELKEQIAEKEKEVEELQKKASEYKSLLGKESTRKKTLQNEIYIFNLKIDKLENDIWLTETQISETELNIEKLALEIETLENSLETQKQYLAQILRTLYEFDEESFLDLILKNQSFSDVFNQIEYIEILQKEIQRKVEAIKILKAQLERDKQEKEDHKTELETLEEQLSDQKQILTGERSEKSYLLKKTKEEEQRYQNLLEETQKKQREIAKEIEELESKLRYTIDPSSIPEFKKGVLSWPSEGILTQGYGSTEDTGFKNNWYIFHNGIDIAAGYGSSIKAATGGVVVGVGDCGKYAYGKWVAINHENGLVTLYGHMSLQKVKIGQKVNRGDVIGYEDSTGFSTGSHLHFTVYAANTFQVVDRWYGPLPLGGSINPLNYL